jgi:N-acetylmuramic acid 6-phosphate etherase
VLNTISTITMIRLGKTYGNLMVDVVAANDKLHDRVRRIVRAATGASSEQVEAALAAADGDARVAIVSVLAGVDAETARARLDRSGRSISEAIEETP